MCKREREEGGGGIEGGREREGGRESVQEREGVRRGRMSVCL